ncbi:MAG: 23S rRNA (uracil(1939)-C(5))-methyltransferase RlmD [Candidatus Eremiobacteraeota bacterium]|nr:23S rRNA (uracil(1939)-C(5))-methyltransferase RlmD [Candidatus Eremiobacteraeota bacterium]
MTNNGGAKPPPADLARTPIHIDDLLANGQGVGRADKLVVFVTGALPGEEVRVAVDAIKANYVSAHAVDILEPSPDRVASVCPVFPRCGGCQTLHLRYEAQLTWKRRMLVDALTRLAGLSPVDVSETVASPLIDGTRYRNKVSLVPQVDGGRGQIGFYAARSHRVVPVDHCPVLLPWLDHAVRALASVVEKSPALLNGVRHIVARTGLAHKTLVVAFCTARRQPQLATQVDMLRQQIPGLTGVVESFDPSSANAIFGRRFATLWGSAETIERVAGASFHFGVASFFQINTGVLERISERLLETLAGARRVVDLYSGVGTFAVILGQRGVAVTGVESFARAVDEAAANAAINSVTTALFERAAVDEAVIGKRGQTLLAEADAVILDPPRSGSQAEVLRALAGARVPHIEYLSCNPATLARDARVLVDAGYRLGGVTPFDMFPHTGHVEALAEFTL